MLMWSDNYELTDKKNVSESNRGIRDCEKDERNFARVYVLE